MPASSWLVGSIYLDAFTFEVNGVNKNVSAGYYYLRHATASLSLIDTLLTQVQTEAAGADWYVTEGRTVRLEPQAAQNVAIDWLSATNVRNLLGYTGNMASQDTPYDAANVSPLLWSPGYVAIPATVLGTAGYVTNDLSIMVSADGTDALTDFHYSQVWQDLSWTHVDAARMRVDDGSTGGGTFHQFHEQCAKLGYSIRYYEQIDEADASTTAVTWDDTTANSHGPFRLRRVDPRWYARVVSNADLYSPLDLSLMQVSEYS